MQTRKFTLCALAAPFLASGLAHAALPVVDWSATWRPFDGYLQEGKLVKVNSAGEIIKLSASGGPTGLDVVVQKYSDSGALLWSSRFDYGSGRDEPLSLGIDAADNIIVGVRRTTS